MSFVVEVEHRFRAVQGLPSPVRARAGLPLLAPGAGVDVVARVGVAFEDGQLTERGWYFDTDAAAADLERCCAELSERPWAEVFPFRPTFELVARHLHGRLAGRLPQIAFVELHDLSFGVRTRYLPPGRRPASGDASTAAEGGGGGGGLMTE